MSTQSWTVDDILWYCSLKETRELHSMLRLPDVQTITRSHRYWSLRLLEAMITDGDKPRLQRLNRILASTFTHGFQRIIITIIDPTKPLVENHDDYVIWEIRKDIPNVRPDNSGIAAPVAR